MIMNFESIINLPEGRRIEFKEQLPVSSELAKTVIAFANDAGGNILIGIKDNPREITGCDSDKLLKIEEKISNIIYDNCSPIIIPDINFHNYNGKHIIRVIIHKGNNPPYFFKSKGENKGTYIRVGSINRLANEELITSLERKNAMFLLTVNLYMIEKLMN